MVGDTDAALEARLRGALVATPLANNRTAAAFMMNLVVELQMCGGESTLELTFLQCIYPRGKCTQLPSQFCVEGYKVSG